MLPIIEFTFCDSISICDYVGFHHWWSFWDPSRISSVVIPYWSLSPYSFLPFYLLFTPFDYIWVFKYTTFLNLEILFKSTYYTLFILINDYETKGRILPREWNEINKNISRVEKRVMVLCEDIQQVK